MIYPAWPETLPAPRRADFGATLTPSVRRQPMESGPDRVTRVSSVDMSNCTHVIVVDKAQAAEFQSFWKNEGNGGADWILVPTLTVNGVAMHKCRFVGDVTVVPDGLDYRIGFSLETDEQHIDWS